MEMKVDVAFHEELDPHSRTAVKSDEGNVVGRGFHESLLRSLRSLLRGEQLEGTAFGVTKTRVMTASLNFEDHTDRRIAAREAGRFFAGEAVDDNEELLFIGTTTIGVDKEKGCDVALTFIQDLKPIHSVVNEGELVDAVTVSEIRFF